MSWEESWQESRTPWDAGASPPALTELVEAKVLPPGRCLVPGAGRGYDVLTLAQEQRLVIGLDVAPTARARFQERLAEHPDRAELAPRVELWTADFFDFDPRGPFDLIWDYTFLCALPLDQRGRYMTRVGELLRPGGELAILLFPVDRVADPQAGPPFQLLPDHIQALAPEAYTLMELRPVHASHPGREGKEWLARFRLP